MSDMRRWFRIFLVVAILGVGGWAAWIYRHRLGFGGAESTVTSAEEAYAAGAKTLEGGDGAAALPRLEEAASQSLKALEKLEKDAAGADQEKAAHLRPLVGRASSVRSRALRDITFAQAAAAGQPLPTTEDSSTGAHFRSFFAIPDARTKGEAIGYLRQAARLLPDQPEVQQEALRTEVVMDPQLNWNLVEGIARNLLKKEPQDTRALYLLARFDFEQPAVDSKTGRGTPTPSEKRDRGRIEKALKSVEQLKEVHDYPYWRTVALEARIHRWLRDYYAARGADDKDAARQKAKEEQQLRELSKQAKERAAALPNEGERLKHFSPWDLLGVFTMQRLAVELPVEDVKAGKDPAEAVKALESLLEFCTKVTALDLKLPWFEQAAEAALDGTARVGELFPSQPPPAWPEQLKTVQDLLAKARDHKVRIPTLYARMADLLMCECTRDVNQDKPDRQKELRKQALGWTEDGLKVGKQAELPSAWLAGLHGQAAEGKLLLGETEDVAKDLQALRDLKRPESDALASLLEGALAAREGRWEKARPLLEDAQREAGGEQARPAQLVLGKVYLALDRPEDALSCLTEAATAYQQYSKLQSRDRAWLKAFAGTSEEVTAQRLAAYLRAAQQTLRRSSQGSAAEVARRHEEKADKLLEDLPARSPRGRAALVDLTTHYAVTGKKDKAAKLLAVLQKDYGGSLEGLRAEVALLAPSAWTPGATVPSDALAAADKRIGEFLKEHGGERAARLYWVEWLARTGRTDKAAEVLRGANGAAGEDLGPHAQELAAIFQAPSDTASRKLFAHLPRDPNAAAQLVELAGEQTEDKGSSLFWKAGGAESKGQFAEAAEDYARVAQGGRYALPAREGLRRCLAAWAEKDSAAVQKRLTELIGEHPDEAALWLGWACAALKQNNLGTPSDNWEANKTLGAALGRWEPAALRQGMPRVAGPLTRAEFWLAAAKPNWARTEAERALKIDPANAAAARLAPNKAP
jgi:hypothetical protein